MLCGAFPTSNVVILQLRPFSWLSLQPQAAECMKEQKFETYFGRKIAVDASMHIYQFMVVVSVLWCS